MDDQARQRFMQEVSSYYSSETSEARQRLDYAIIRARAFHDDQLAPLEAMAVLIQLMRGDSDDSTHS